MIFSSFTEVSWLFHLFFLMAVSPTREFLVGFGNQLNRKKKVFDDKILTLDFFHRRKWIILVFLCGNDRLISGSKIVAFLWYFYSHAYLVEIRFVQKKKYLIDVRFVINDWNKAFNLFIKSFKLMFSPKSKWWHSDSLAYMKIYLCAILAVADVFRYGSIRKHEFRYFVCDRTECDSDVIERGK